MLTLTEQRGNTIYYKCSCGAKGMCSFKSVEHKTIVIVRCPVCQEVERLILSDKTKENDFDNDLSWTPSVSEEI